MEETKSSDDALYSCSHALNILRDNGFKVFSSWDSLARELGVPLDFRRQLRHQAASTEDYSRALEESLEYWIKNDTGHSWKVLLEALEKTDEKEVAKKVRKRLNIADLSQSSARVSKSPLREPTVPSSTESKALKSFRDIQERLQPLLLLSINDFASKCFSNDLISMDVYEKIFNHTPSTDSERAKYLIHIIYKRAESLEANGSWSEARDVIHKFGEIVYGVDCVLRHIGTEIMSLEDSQSLMSKQDRIKSSIQSSLHSVAMKLMSQGMISDEEYDTTTDPDSNQSKRHLMEIFRTLREVIKQNYQKYTVLLQVLKDMGPPISVAALKIVDQSS